MMTLARTLCMAACLASFAGCQSGEERTRAIYIIEESGDFAYERGDYGLAVREYEEVVERRPGKLSARIDLGKALLAAGEPEAALEHLSAARNIDPDNDRVIKLLAQAMLGAGETASMTALLRAEANDDNDPESWMRLGRFLNMAGDADEAERALLEAARLDAGMSVGPQLALARFYESIGDTEEAVRRYRMVLYVEPRNERAKAYLRSQGHIPGPTFALEPTER